MLLYIFSDIDKRVEILQRINRLLVAECMIKLPAFITNDYIDRTLDLLEERLNSLDNSKVDANNKKQDMLIKYRCFTLN